MSCNYTTDVLNKYTFIATEKFYDSFLIQSLGDHVSKVPTAGLFLIAVQLVFVGSFAAIRKPQNAKDPKRDHPLFDPTDVDHSSEDDIYEDIGKTYAAAFPVIAGATLLGLNYLINNYSITTILYYLNYYIVSSSILPNYLVFSYLLNATNRVVTRGLNLGSFVSRYRVSFAVDSAVNATGIQVNEERVEEESKKYFNSWLSIFNLSVREKLLSKQEEKLRKKLRKKQTPVEKADQLFNVFYSSADYLAVPLSLGVSYLFSKNQNNWILNNIIGSTFAIFGIKTARINSFKTGLVLLSGLFFYDIYFVFGSTVMENVATNLEIPIKLVFPKSPKTLVDGALSASMLGLGDIVVPGTFVSLALRFDLFKYHRANPKTEFHLLNKYCKQYFIASLFGYITGLVATMVSLHVYNRPQPALLYICPSIIVSTFGWALVKREVSLLWKFSETEDFEDVPVESVEVEVTEIIEDDTTTETRTWKEFLDYPFKDEEDEDDDDYSELDVLIADTYISEEEFEHSDDDEDEDEEESTLNAISFAQLK